MRKNFKSYALGFLSASVIFGGLTYALQATETVQRTFRDIKIVVEGNTITPKDANGKVVEPFIIEGSTFLPVRAVAEALGLNVAWNESTSTVTLGKGEIAQGNNTSTQVTPEPKQASTPVPNISTEGVDTSLSSPAELGQKAMFESKYEFGKIGISIAEITVPRKASFNREFEFTIDVSKESNYRKSVLKRYLDLFADVYDKNGKLVHEAGSLYPIGFFDKDGNPVSVEDLPVDVSGVYIYEIGDSVLNKIATIKYTYQIVDGWFEGKEGLDSEFVFGVGDYNSSKWPTIQKAYFRIPKYNTSGTSSNTIKEQVQIKASTPAPTAIPRIITTKAPSTGTNVDEVLKAREELYKLLGK
jgi:hypothetical protein